MKEIYQQLLHINRNICDLSTLITAKAKELVNCSEDEFSKLWNVKFGKLPVVFKATFDIGCCSKGYEPTLELYSFGDEDLSLTKDWQWIDRCTFESFDSGPIEISTLKEFIEEYNQTHPWKTEVDFVILRQPTNDNFEFFEELEVVYKEKNPVLIEEGAIWYRGWDIPDRFIIVSFNDKKIRIFTISNGFDIDKPVECIEPGQTTKLAKFFEKCQTQEVYIKTTQMEILENWK